MERATFVCGAALLATFALFGCSEPESRVVRHCKAVAAELAYNPSGMKFVDVREAPQGNGAVVAFDDTNQYGAPTRRDLHCQYQQRDGLLAQIIIDHELVADEERSLLALKANLAIDRSQSP